MQRVVTQYKNNLKYRAKGYYPPAGETLAERINFVPLNAKLLAWAIFLIFFFEVGTLGLLPKSMYFIYRNVRISDFILYSVIIYSFFCIREYKELFFSKSFIIVKILFTYILFQFLISVIYYKVEVVEYFFRMKYLWMSLLVFPYMLLLKRNGLKFFVKILLPFSIISNIFYTISAVTGVPLLPDITVVQQTLPGDLKVWRVYGGTFYGELFLLGIVFYWTEYKFRLIQVPLIVLFGLPHILSFGRGTWVFFIFAISFIVIWSSYRKHNVKSMLKQAIVLVITFIAFMYSFNKFLPEPEELSDSIQARIQQGEEDVRYSEGTIGTRLVNQKALFDLWTVNPVFGIGMHPFWIIKPVTTEEAVYARGFHDLRWVSILVAYGATGFLLAIIFQVYYLVKTFKLLRRITKQDINYFFLLIFMIMMLRDSLIGYLFMLTSVSLNILGPLVAFYVANMIYLYEKHSFGTLKNGAPQPS